MTSLFIQRKDGGIFRETAKNPRASTQALQASVSMLNVKVNDSTIRKHLENASSLLEQCPLDRRDQSGDVWS